MMPLRTTFLFLLLLSPYFPNATGKSTNEHCWEEGVLLSWQDFNGIAQAQTIHAAMTHIAIGYEMLSEKKLLITNCMVKNKSWVRPQSRNAEILMHEQLHFDIAEVYARKMRQEMSTLDVMKGARVKSIFKKWIKLYNKEQSQYDKETSHSQKKSEQIRWQEKTDQALKDLESYKESLVILN